MNCNINRSFRFCFGVALIVTIVVFSMAPPRAYASEIDSDNLLSELDASVLSVEQIKKKLAIAGKNFETV